MGRGINVHTKIENVMKPMSLSLNLIFDSWRVGGCLRPNAKATIAQIIHPFHRVTPAYRRKPISTKVMGL
jgi:hypothetical protein